LQRCAPLWGALRATDDKFGVRKPASPVKIMVHETKPTQKGVKNGRSHYFMQIRKVFEDFADLEQGNIS